MFRLEISIYFVDPFEGLYSFNVIDQLNTIEIIFADFCISVVEILPPTVILLIVNTQKFDKMICKCALI